MDFVSGDKINVSFYTSNDLYLHRTKTIQKEHIKTTQYMKMLTPPLTIGEAERLCEEKTIKFEINKSCNLFISGIGFVHLVTEGAFIDVTVPKMIQVEVMEDEASCE